MYCYYTYNNSKVKSTISKSIQGFAGNDPWVVIINRIVYIPLIDNIFNPLRHSKGLYAIIDATAPNPVPVTKSKHMLMKSSWLCQMDTL